VELSKFLIESTRLTGTRKAIRVVDPERFEQFLIALSESDLEDKALIGILVTGGLRVSEGLSLRKRDFFAENGKLYFKSPVLKKGSALRRIVLVHPKLKPTIEQALGKVRQYDLVFKVSRKTVWTHIKKIFGADACPHSIARHSYISWLLHEKKLSAHEAARVVEVKVSTIEAYNHPNVKKKLGELFGAA